MLSAYYEGRGLAVHPIGADGAVADPPVERRETARGAHCFQTDPSNRFAFVPHIAGRGPNEIWQFRFDQETGRLTPNTPAKAIPPGEIGPRHYCFHPAKETGQGHVTREVGPAPRVSIFVPSVSEHRRALDP